MTFGDRSVVAAALICASAAAQAQGVVGLVCSSRPDGPPEFQIEIDFDRSMVRYLGPATPARISENEIVWERPRQERAAAR